LNKQFQQNGPSHCSHIATHAIIKHGKTEL